MRPRNMTQPSDLPPPEPPIRAKHIRAPQGDGETLIDPPVDDALLHAGIGNPLFVSSTFQLFPGADAARAQFVQAAIQYTSHYSYAPQLRHTKATKVVVAGHQPELFHPGVWLKNFVLDRCGQSPNTLAINLTIDNDIARHTSVRIPVGDPSQPRLEEIHLDETSAAIPYEERRVASRSSLRSFPDRLRAAFDQRVWFRRESQKLLVDEVWRKLAWGDAKRLPLGELLAQARHRCEQDLGLQTLELPLSHIAQTEHFRNFALRILHDLPKFREIYNQSLAEYRIVNKIRSNSHPVPPLAVETEPIPELSVEGEWIEAPFWIWSKENPRRRRLFIRQDRLGDQHSTIAFTDRDKIVNSIVGKNDDPESWLHMWRGLEEFCGIKIRPRALITTMYARLFLSDLFIHGIGGAKYDELTDAIIRRFFGIEPPAFMTVTGTVRLPIPRPEVSAADVRSVKQLIREIRFHPEKFVNDASPALRDSATQFAAQKQELLRQHQFHFRGASPEQFRALDDLNRQLSLLLTDVEIRLRDELKTTEQDYQTARILGSREFSFVLHPADTLPEQLKRMASS